MSATLTIESGLHQGATIALAARAYVIGSGDDCDIVLRDSTLAPRHCLLKRGWSGFTLQDLRDEKPILPQATEYVGGAIDVGYNLAGVTIKLRLEETQASPTRSRWVGGSVLAAGLVMAIVAFAAKLDSATPEVSAPQSNEARRAAADAALLEQVKNTFADEALNVSLRDGKLHIAGQTSHREVKQRIRSLADDLRGVVAVEDGVTYVDDGKGTSLGPFPVKLRSVMVGNPSYFLTDRGVRYFVGGVLPDGAEVLAIESRQIRLRAGGKDVIYSLE